MTQVALLPSVVIIFSLSIAVILVCDRLRLPTIVGFLVTGIIGGPHGLKLVSDITDVQHLAEIGVVLLLFKIGMKLTVAKISAFRRFFFISAPLQVVLTILCGVGVAQYLGRPMPESIFLGFLLSLSSTAIVFKLLEDHDATGSPHGKVMLGILIFQDIAAVLMMLATPHLTESAMEKVNYYFLLGLMKGLIILLIVFFTATRIIPKLLYYIARTEHRELFILSIMAICFGVAWLASSLGLSLSLGAFLAGVMIADSEYSTEAIGSVIPYQEVLISFFFVSVGMLFDISFVYDHPVETVLVTLGILLLKSFVTTSVVILTGMPLRTSVLAGIGLAQIGEFSFVLMRFGAAAGIGSTYHYQLFLAVSVLTMALTPFLMFIAPIVARGMLRLPFPLALKGGFRPLKPSKLEKVKEDHLIIVGHGFNGQHLAFAAKRAKIPYLVLEMNADIVKAEKRRGEPIYFGDATHDAVLNHANTKDARVLTVIVNDPVAALRITQHARKLNPSLYILVRCRYVNQMPPLFRAGANEVVPEEFATSVEVFTHVLQRYGVSEEQIERSINEMRDEGYQLIRHLFYTEKEQPDLYLRLRDAVVTTLRVGAGSAVAGKTLFECDLKGKYGVQVLLLERGSDVIFPADETMLLDVHDTLIALGSKEGLAHAAERVQSNSLLAPS